MTLRDAAINNSKPERIFELTNDHAVDFVSLLDLISIPAAILFLSDSGLNFTVFFFVLYLSNSSLSVKSHSSLSFFYWLVLCRFYIYNA